MRFDGEDFKLVDGWWTCPDVIKPRRDGLRREKSLQNSNRADA